MSKKDQNVLNREAWDQFVKTNPMLGNVIFYHSYMESLPGIGVLLDFGVKEGDIVIKVATHMTGGYIMNQIYLGPMVISIADFYRAMRNEDLPLGPQGLYNRASRLANYIQNNQVEIYSGWIDHYKFVRVMATDKQDAKDKITKALKFIIDRGEYNPINFKGPIIFGDPASPMSRYSPVKAQNVLKEFEKAGRVVVDASKLEWMSLPSYYTTPPFLPQNTNSMDLIFKDSD